MPRGGPTERTNETSTNRRSIRLRRVPATRASASQRLPDMSNTPRNTQTNRQFMFIDQDADRTTSNELIRVHVMRESHRARRQLRGLMQPSTESHGQMTIFSTTAPAPPRRQLPSREPSAENSPEQSPNRESDVARRQSQVDTADSAELRRLAQERLLTVLSTTSTKIAAATPGYQVLESLPRNVVELCDDDTAALHALLALITAVQNSVALLQAAEHESSALEILRTRLAGPAAEHADETMTTVLLLSRLERCRMNEETAGFHEAALLRMVQDRGGFEALASSNDGLATMLRSYGLGEQT